MSIIIVPKIIHQIWIGPKQAPTEWMQTWKTKNPDYHYICWNEERLQQLDTLTCIEPLKNIREINGQADIFRWEILYTYGGYFFDADSICYRGLGDDFVGARAFSCYENEVVRPGLVATGAMGFPPKHPLIRFIIDHMKTPEYQESIRQLHAWKSVGPGLLTFALKACPQYPISILPSYLFYPKHHTGKLYRGHFKGYAYQYWCTSHQLYDNNTEEINEANEELKEIIVAPTEWVSIVVPCHNTLPEYIAECLFSIQIQVGNFGMELVWINDGSSSENSAAQIHLLKQFETSSRHVRVVYLDNITQQGCRNSLRKAVEHCTCEYIFKMDSDDVMVANRIELQLEFMKRHPTLALSGGQVDYLKEGQEGQDGQKPIGEQVTRHPETMTREEFMKSMPEWFMNHPTFCFRREALLSAGNYPEQSLPIFSPVENMMDDYEVVLRILKRFGMVQNMKEVLVHYRIHSDQMTFKIRGPELDEYRWKIVAKYFGAKNFGCINI